MYRILNVILIFSVLMTQSAWAVHAVGVDENPPGYSQPAEQNDKVADNCNHFCHASAHLLGLFSDSTTDIQTSRDTHETGLTGLISNLNYQPPTPPPIS